MQTFLPCPDIRKSLECLDYRRLGKQRIEAKQILNCLKFNLKGWHNHPAVLMWRGYESALCLYMNVAIETWTSKGYKNTMQFINVSDVVYPWWFGHEEFHASHRGNLLRKNYGHYSQFGWTESPELPYWWPTQNIKNEK